MRLPPASLCSLILFTTLATGQTPGVNPPPNLTVDGVPTIPASTAEGAQKYTRGRSAAFVAWHPVDLTMLISTRFADVDQIHQVRFPGGARAQLTFFDDPVRTASYQPTHGRYFVFSKDSGGGEWYQNFRYDPATGEVSLLTDGKSRNTLGVWSTKGDRMAYGSTRRNGKDIDFYVIDPLHPADNAMLVRLDRGESWSVLAWSPNDSTLLAREGLSASESYLWLIDMIRHDRRLLTPKHGGTAVSYAGGRFSRDGSGIYTTCDAQSEFHRLVFIDLATGKQTPLAPDIAWDVDAFDISRDGKMIAFTSNEDGVSVLYLLNLQTGTRQSVAGLPIGVIRNLHWHNDGSHLAFTLTSARTGTDVFVLNIQSGAVERWTTSEMGGPPIETFAEPQLVRWKSFDGRTISGFLYRPPATFGGKRPVMVAIHGGPEGQARPTFLARMNYYLNELGVALLFPNVRGSTGYGKTFLGLDNGAHREDSYKDIAAALDWIKTQGDLAPDRILVTGASYGGHATLAVEAFYSEKIRCAVDVVGMSNLVTFLERTQAYRRDLRRAEYGDERDTTMRSYLERIAPLNNTATMSRPVFIVQGKNDPRVPATESEQMVEALKKRGTPVWYLVADDEGHGFGKKRNIDFQFYATIQFMKTYLLN